MNEEYMKLAIHLAKRGRGKTSPNPLVGAVIVKDGMVIGKGYHKKAGGDHAEIIALKEAGVHAEDSELYLNLEPCCHFGKTPPCTEAILKSGIKKVIIGMEDPNPLVSGKGIDILRDRGVKTEVGLLKEDCERLNEVFIKYISTGKPFVILKAAASLDGKIATSTGESRWITGEKSRNFVHRLRNQVDAIMVGIGTIVKDDPRLTTRIKGNMGKDPIRIVVDTRLNILPEAKVFNPDSKAKTIIVTGKSVPRKKIARIEEAGGIVLPVEKVKGRVDLIKTIRLLGKMEITSIMIEGGSKINDSVLKSGIVDKFYLFLAPKIIGGSEAAGIVGGEGLKRLSDAVRLKDLSVRKLGSDLLIESYLN